METNTGIDIYWKPLEAAQPLSITTMTAGRIFFWPAALALTDYLLTSRSTNRLYRNNGDGKFSDMTEKAGLVRTGWAQGVCVGDYENDGYDDLFVSSYGKNALYHNNGNSTFTEVAEKAGVVNNRTRWGSGCAFLDYDRDGYLDLFVASYIDLDLKTAPLPETGPCLYKGLTVACGPPGLTGGINMLYRQ